MTAPAPGPLATEAALLLDVLAERLTALQPGLRPAPGTSDPATGHRPHPGGEQPAGHPAGPACTTGCPFCQVLAVVRGERPETAARLVDGALLVVRSLRSLLDHADHAPDTGRAAGPPAPPAGTTTHRPDGTDSSADQAASTGTGTAPQARVEWIDIR